MRPRPTRDVEADLAALDRKLNDFLPPRYQHCYESVSPVSMGSSGLKYDRDGRVAWDEVWTTFCDLALAGGPPHRGVLLEPVAPADLDADPDGSGAVVAEIGRAVGLTTGLDAVAGSERGWVGVRCESNAEAAWLQFAVTAENVSARRREAVLQLPAGPGYRPEKEIKNVVVALAKSAHYWDGHISGAQCGLAGDDRWEAASPAEAAADPGRYDALMAEVEDRLRAAGRTPLPRRYTGWVGVETSGEEEAVWTLRAILVEGVLARREGDRIYLPVNPAPGANHADRVLATIRGASDLWVSSRGRRDR